MANLYLKALSSPGSDQPKLFTVLGDWDLEGVLVALFAEARIEPAERAPNSRQSSWQGGRRGDGQLDNALVIICFQAAKTARETHITHRHNSQALSSVMSPCCVQKE